MVTTNPKEALSGAEVILMVLPAFGQKRFAEVCAPHLEDGQSLVLTPGNFGGEIEFAGVLSALANKPEVIVAEMECRIYSGLQVRADGSLVSGYKKGLRVAAYPPTDTTTE